MVLTFNSGDVIFRIFFRILEIIAVANYLGHPESFAMAWNRATTIDFHGQTVYL
jgi:hypothetical protein